MGPEDPVEYILGTAEEMFETLTGLGDGQQDDDDD